MAALYWIASQRDRDYAYNHKRFEMVKCGFHTCFETEEEARKAAIGLREHYQICLGNAIVYDSLIDGKCEGIDPHTYTGIG